MSTGTLFLIPNTLDFGAEPGDIQDTIPLGVLKQAARLTHWVAENAKTTRAFLKRVNEVAPLQAPLQSINITELPRPAKGGGNTIKATDVTTLLAPTLAGHDLGLISEAGLPAVADPGAALVEAAHAAGVIVQALSGPSSLMLALAASGLNGQSFSFVGYLPVEAPARAQRLRELEALAKRHNQTQLMIETPYRNTAFLQAMLTSLQPGTKVSVSCGLTIQGGWTRTATVAEWRKGDATLPDRLPAVFALLG